MAAILFRSQSVQILHGDPSCSEETIYQVWWPDNSLWPTDTIWQHRSKSTLAHCQTWLVAWQHQAISWTNADLSSVRSSGNHQGALLYGDLKIPLSKIKLKIVCLQWHTDFWETNELKWPVRFCDISQHHDCKPFSMEILLALREMM